MPDVNGTTYQLLLGRDDWARCGPLPYGRRWRYDQPRELLTLRPLPFAFPQPAGDRGLSIDDRRGATRDRHGHWYWVGPDGRSIRVRWAAADGPGDFWPPTGAACEPAGPGAAFRPRNRAPAGREELRGLAATTGHYLVAGVAGGLLIFDLHTGGAPTRLGLPPARPGVPTVPFDLAPLADGGVAVLDSDSRVAWVLDSTFRPRPLSATGRSDPLLFQPRGGEPRRSPTSAPAAPIDLGTCERPISVEPMPDGSLLVLDRPAAGPGVVRRYAPGAPGPLGEAALTPGALGDPEEPPLGLAPIQAHDIAFVPAPEGEAAGTLFVAAAGGNQAFGLRVGPGAGLELRIEPRFYPMRGATGKALVAPLGAEHAYYDQGELWLPLAELPRRRYEERAELLTPALDGHTPGCVWHRLCIDACIPATTSIRVESRASDELALLPLEPWRPEPALYRRGGGSELPYQSLWGRAELRRPDAGTWELLLQRAEGRYLELRLTLEGDGRSTPAIRGLRAHYPRFSYARAYLPPLYQEDRASLDFIERFLANPEGLLTTIEGQIAGSQAFVDPRTVPEEAVAWLGAWLGLAFDPAWSDHQRRLLLANAPYFFQRRGTVAGITQAIRIAIDPEAGPEIFQDRQDSPRAGVRIVENFQTRRFSRAALGDSSGDEEATTGDVRVDARARAHRFTVLVPASICAGRIPGVEGLIERVVAAEKPAHTAFTMRRFWALFRVGEARLAIDTALGEGGRFAPLQLDTTALAEGRLVAAYPSNLSDRVVLDR